MRDSFVVVTTRLLVNKHGGLVISKAADLPTKGFDFLCLFGIDREPDAKMSQHAFHRSGTVLSNEEIVFVCRALISHQLKLLCLRECKLSGKDLHRILKLVGECSSLQQLTLNVGMIKSVKDVESLAHCIKKNKSLTGLQ